VKLARENKGRRIVNLDAFFGDAKTNDRARGGSSMPDEAIEMPGIKE